MMETPPKIKLDVEDASDLCEYLREKIALTQTRMQRELEYLFKGDDVKWLRDGCKRALEKALGEEQRLLQILTLALGLNQPLKPGTRVAVIRSLGCFLRKGRRGTVTAKIPPEKVKSYVHEAGTDDVWQVRFDEVTLGDDLERDYLNELLCSVRRPELRIIEEIEP